jgi:threonyl-tRNA synthetase
VEADLRNEKINYKVREHSLAKVPVIAVVGRREAESNQVALRRLGSDRQEVVGLDAASIALALEASPPDVAVGVSGADSTREAVGAMEAG